MSGRRMSIAGGVNQLKWKAKEKNADLRAKQHGAGIAAIVEQEESEESEPPIEPTVTEEEIMASWPVQMGDETFDPALHALQQLDVGADESAIQERVAVTERGIDVMSARLAEGVLGDYAAFTASVGKVGQVERQLTQCIDEVRVARRSLGNAEQELVQGGIQILHKLRQKKLYSEVVEMLLRLKKLVQHKDRCVAAMEGRDFPHMIAFAALYRDGLREFEAIGSVTQLTAAVDDAMESLDGLMAETCLNLCRDEFDADEYHGLLQAADKLRQLPMLQHNIQRNFEEAVTTTAISTVYVMSIHRTNSGRDVAPVMQPQAAGSVSKAKQFAEIVKQLKPSQVFLTAMKLYSALSAIMHNMFQFVRWHVRVDTAAVEPKLQAASSEQNQEQEQETPSRVSPYAIVRESLGTSRAYIFQRVMDLLGEFIDNLKVTAIAAENFLSFIVGTHKFVALAERFGMMSQRASSAVQDKIQQKCELFWVEFHGSRLMELRLSIDHEQWVIPAGISPDALDVEAARFHIPSELSADTPALYEDVCDDGGGPSGDPSGGVGLWNPFSQFAEEDADDAVLPSAPTTQAEQGRMGAYTQSSLKLIRLISA